MKEGTGSRFLIGCLFGVMIGALIWYWQKSTSAEDGALALLDRLATAESKLRHLQAKQPGELSGVAAEGIRASDSAEQPDPMQADDLQAVKGIGPVFEKRLHQAGILNLDRLCEIDADDLAQILDVNDVRAQSILGEAKRRML